ncbi:MAG: hypothetical protein LBC90_05750 [Candidatus Adiutrix sp.]|jgi:hypothetical protein|nr:hypothetical protein [Candidatus Adiutrix sp.]
MTVSSPLAKAVHLTQGAIVDYAFPFKVFKEGELIVSLVDASFLVTDLALGADYTVGGLGRDQGGTVSLTPAGRGKAGTGLSLVILRRMDITQEIDYRPHDVFPAETHERALDILTMICQELREMMSRALVAPPNLSGPIQYGDLAALALRAEEAAGEAARAVAGLSESGPGQAGVPELLEALSRRADALETAWPALAADLAGKADISALPAAADLGGQGAAAFGQAAQNGTAVTFARSDHKHALPAAPGGGSIGPVWVRPDATSALVLPPGGTWSGFYAIRVGSGGANFGYTTVYAFADKAGGSTLHAGSGANYLMMALALRTA